MNDHFRAWLDTPIPALGDLTPRAATRDPARRAPLLDLLKDLELNEAKLSTRFGDRIYDFAWLWRELGWQPGSEEYFPPVQGASGRA